MDDTFGEGVQRPLGVTAEVMPAMRRFVEEIDNVGEFVASK